MSSNTGTAAAATVKQSQPEETKQVEMQQKFVYPVPADLEVIDLSLEHVHAVEHFWMPPRFKPYIKNIILPDGLIQARWRRLAERILIDYAQESELIMIVLMSGGYKFYEDLKK